MEYVGCSGHVPGPFTQKRVQPSVEGRQGRFIQVGGSQTKTGLRGSRTGAYVVCKLKKRIFIAVISVEAILFDSLIFLYITKETFPFTTKGKCGNTGNFLNDCVSNS